MKSIALWLLAIPLLGCGATTRGSGAPASPNSYFITDDKIAQSGARTAWDALRTARRSEEHTSGLQSLRQLVCRLMLEKKINEQPLASTGTARQGRTAR